MSGKQKTRVNVSLDPELYRRAKALGLNVSGVSGRALRVYPDRLENGSGDSVATPATDTPTDSGESSTDETDAEYTDASTEEILDGYRQFATSVLDRSENTVDRTPATSSDFSSMPTDHRRALPKTTSQTTSIRKGT